MLLWIIFAAITAAALIAVLWPILRGEKPSRDDGMSYDAAVFKDQINEIEAELDSGLITASEAESARTEVSRRLLTASKLQEDSLKHRLDAGKNRTAALVLIAAFMLVPASSSVLYLVYGSPGLSDQPLSARLSKSVEGRNIETLLAQVETRLREHPQDGRGWEVIAPAYLRQRRFSDAADAYGRALRILGETPQRLSDYGNALVLARDGVVTEPARKVLDRAISLDSNMMRARFWLAVAHEQDGDAEKAITAWKDLLSRSDKDAPWRAAVQERLQAIELRIGSKKSTVTASSPSKADNGNQLKGPTSADISAAHEMSAEDRSAMIGQMVAGLSERLRSNGGNPAEWQRLIRSYSILGKKTEAMKALADARTAFSGKSEILRELDALAKNLSLKDNP